MGLSTQSLSFIYILPPDFKEDQEIKLYSILETLFNVRYHHFHHFTYGLFRSTSIYKCIRAQVLWENTWTSERERRKTRSSRKAQNEFKNLHCSSHVIRAVKSITLVNKDFGPWGKMFFCYVFLDAEFEYVSRISLSHTPFALHQTMWPHTPTYVNHWRPVGGSLDMMQQATCHESFLCGWQSSAGCWPELSVLSSQKYVVFVPPLICQESV